MMVREESSVKPKYLDSKDEKCFTFLKQKYSTLINKKKNKKCLMVSPGQANRQK